MLHNIVMVFAIHQHGSAMGQLLKPRRPKSPRATTPLSVATAEAGVPRACAQQQEKRGETHALQ